jgi:hypothetical protein
MFFSRAFGSTFGEATPEVKLEVSHHEEARRKNVGTLRAESRLLEQTLFYLFYLLFADIFETELFAHKLNGRLVVESADNIGVGKSTREGLRGL